MEGSFSDSFPEGHGGITKTHIKIKAHDGIGLQSSLSNV